MSPLNISKWTKLAEKLALEWASENYKVLRVPSNSDRTFWLIHSLVDMWRMTINHEEILDEYIDSIVEDWITQYTKLEVDGKEYRALISTFKTMYKLAHAED